MPFFSSKNTGALVGLDVLFSGSVLRAGGVLVVGDAVVRMGVGIAVGVNVGTLQPLDKNNNNKLLM